jgi:NADPH:quinone reductase-like Zn-dependent oxidoreductase
MKEGPVMQAFVYERYGPPERLRVAEVDPPVPDAGQVLVKVLAASVNAADWHVLRGKPLFSRATLGLLRPKHQILGVDVAGQVAAVGGGVSRFQAGDEVYANLLDHGYGGFAEQVAVPGDGASGGVGSFAVQLVKADRAEVTAVTSTPNLELVRSLGADHLVDYATTDALRDGRRYDRILDTVGNRSVADLRRALAPGGKAAVNRFADLPAAIAYLEQGHARAKVVVALTGS